MITKTEDAKDANKGGFNWRFWLGILFTFVTVGWLLLTTDWQEIWSQLAQANLLLIGAAILLNIANIPIRAWRWRHLFPREQPPPMDLLMSALLIGQIVNVMTPSRLGDLIRASLIKGYKTSFVLGTQIMQTGFDLLMLAVLIVVMLFQVTLPDWWRDSGRAMLLTAVIAILMLIIMVFARKRIAHFLEHIPQRWPRLHYPRLLEIGVNFLRSLDTFTRPLTLIWVIGISIIIWLIYGFTNYAILVALTPQDAALPPQMAILASFFVLIVLQLGIAVPSTPGRVGVFHYISVQALTVFAIARATAVSFSILLHLVSIVMPMGIGALLAWRMGIGLGRKGQHPLVVEGSGE